MPSSYLNDLRIELQADGENASLWGQKLNDALTQIGDALAYGTQDCFATDANATTTVADGAADPARAMYFKVTSTATLTATRTLTIAPNTISRVMFIENATTGSQSITISQGSGSTVTIATGKTAVVYLDGAGATAAVVDAMAKVDPGVTDTLAEVLVAGNTSGGTGLTMSSGDDLTLTGAAYNVVWDSSANSLTFADNAKAVFGAGSDLQIYHDGSDSYINDTGTGNLFVRASDNFYVQNSAGTETKAAFTTDGAVKLYYNGGTKLQTVSGGIDVTGGITSSGNLTVNGADVTITANIIHSGDGDTYFGFNDNDSYRVVTGGTQRLLVNSSGIDVTGTVTADGLTVSPSGTQQVLATLRANSGAGGGLVVQTDASDDGLIRGYDSAGNVQLQFDTDGGDNYIAQGNVGIGTASPDTLLHLSDTAGGAVIRLERNDTTIASTDVYGEIQFEGQDASAGSAAGIRGKILGVAEGATGEMALAFQTASGYGSSTERMRIDSSGRVGIGTSSPVGLLNVEAPSGNSQLYITTNDTTSVSQLIFGDSADSNVGGLQYNHTDDSLQFHVGNVGEKMRIDSSGNVVIGATSVSNPNSYGAVLNVEGYAPALVLSEDTGRDYTIGVNGNNLNIFNETTNVLTIADSGKVGIGTTPVRVLDIATTTGGTIIHLTDDATGHTATDGVDIQQEGTLFQILNREAGDIRFGTNNTERMRIDADGKLLVGTTHNSLYNSSTQADAGVLIDGTNDNLQVARWEGTPLFVNRMSTDGTIVDFRKDGTTVGSIGADYTGTSAAGLFIGNGTNGLFFNGSADIIQPYSITGGENVDNTIDLGNSAKRFKDLYLSGGVYLGGTGAANYLDDYEEGTWTPIFSPATAFTSITYDAARGGTYTKVGNVVHIRGALRTDQISGGSGNVKIGGLPFTSSSSAPLGTFSIGYLNNFSGDFPGGIYVNGGATTATITYRTGANTGLDNDLQVADLNAGGNANYILFSGSYYVD